MNLVRNERAKLTATYVNGLGIALFAVGGLAPLFSRLFAPADPAAQLPLWIVLAVSVVCFLVSVALHLTGRWVLRDLQP